MKKALESINHLIGFFLLLSFVFFSCTSKNSDERFANYSYELEIIDSLTVDYMGSLELLSIDPSRDLFLFAGQEQGELLLTNRNGVILQAFKKPIDAPDSFGPYVQGATFLGDTLLVFGVSHFAMYDLEFNLIQKFKKSYANRGMIYVGFDHLQVGKKDGKSILVAFSGGPQTEYPTNSKDYYASFNTFDIIDKENKSFTPIVPFHPRSRYSKGAEAFNFIKPSFAVKDNLISFIYQRDSLFFQYDIATESYTAEKIPFEKFIINRGFPIGGEEDYDSPKDRGGEITQLLQVGDQHLIAYRSGLTLDELPGPEVKQEERWPAILKLDTEKVIVRNSQGTYSQPFTIPNRCRLVRTDNLGRIWATQVVEALEFEPDFVTFYELKLVKKLE